MASAARFLSSHHPITLADSEPEPDVVLIRGDMRDYSARHPKEANLCCRWRPNLLADRFDQFPA
jgi:hypothetical protein